jgi:hypothetical protein
LQSRSAEMVPGSQLSGIASARQDHWWGPCSSLTVSFRPHPLVTAIATGNGGRGVVRLGPSDGRTLTSRCDPFPDFSIRRSTARRAHTSGRGTGALTPNYSSASGQRKSTSCGATRAWEALVRVVPGPFLFLGSGRQVAGPTSARKPPMGEPTVRRTCSDKSAEIAIRHSRPRLVGPIFAEWPRT